ncbi:MAG: TspO/MBR family protein [Pseudomonadota bacterium]
MNKYTKLALWIGIYLAVAFGIGQITQGSIDSWYIDLEKSSLTPPNYVFPIMWTILYIMIATAGWKLWTTECDHYLKILYIRYTVLNLAWTPVFFGFHWIFAALGVIILLNIAAALIIKKAWKQVRLVSYLMIPPTLWTLFAAYLNLMIFSLNT